MSQPKPCDQCGKPPTYYAVGKTKMHHACSDAHCTPDLSWKSVSGLDGALYGALAAGLEMKKGFGF